MRPRPGELGRWFKLGRRLGTPNHLPQLGSVEDFEDSWVQWWSASQPKWRDTRHWPFAREDAVEQRDWSVLSGGGKNGLFLVVVSLGWWIHKRDPSKDSKVDDAIADVAWVIDNLVSFLSSDLDSDSELDSHVARSPVRLGKRSESVKIGPPPRRAKRARS